MDMYNDISKWIDDNFALSRKVKVELLRAYTNDVYKIESHDKHVLKVYGEGWKTESEVLWEIELLDYLKDHGVEVAGAIEGKLGTKLFTLNMNGNQRLAVLFEWAKGKKPMPPFSLDDYEILGKATAKIHLVSNGFSSNQKRQELDVEFLINKPMSIIRDSGATDDKIKFLQKYADRLKEYIQEFESKGLDWGVVHADVTFDNIHMTDNREIVFYDFDSGGLGWRAIDLGGWAVFDPETVLRQTSFIKGYKTVRDISDNDVMASPYLHAANEFWGLGLDLNRRVAIQGKEAVDKYLAEKMEMFEKFFDYFNSCPSKTALSL